MTASTPLIPQRTRRPRPITADGHEVRLIAVEPQIAAPAQRGSDGRERSRYQVEVDGVLRGHIVYIQSWYGSWEAINLGTLTQNGHHPERLNSIVTPDGSPYQKPSRDSLARAFPEWVSAGRAPSHDELAAYRANDAGMQQLERKTDREEREAEQSRWATLRAEIAAREQAKMDKEHERIMILDALRARGATILTNAEIDALACTVDQLRKRYNICKY